MLIVSCFREEAYTYMCACVTAIHALRHNEAVQRNILSIIVRLQFQDTNGLWHLLHDYVVHFTFLRLFVFGIDVHLTPKMESC